MIGIKRRWKKSCRQKGKCITKIDQLTLYASVQIGIYIRWWLITLKLYMFLVALLLVLCIIFGYTCVYLLLNHEKLYIQANVAKNR